MRRTVVRDGQFDYDKGATSLVSALNEYSQPAGKGWGPDSFANVDMKTAEKFLKAWAASVESVVHRRSLTYDGHATPCARFPAGCGASACPSPYGA